MRILLLLLILYSTSATAQDHYLDGDWDGYIILNQQRMVFRIHIDIYGKGKVRGYTLLELPTHEIVEMKITGQVHLDRSVTIHEVRAEETAAIETSDWYKKRLQLVFRQSIEEQTLNGYWQEAILQMTDEFSRVGRVFLKKENTKA